MRFPLVAQCHVLFFLQATQRFVNTCHMLRFINTFFSVDKRFELQPKQCTTQPRGVCSLAEISMTFPEKDLNWMVEQVIY